MNINKINSTNFNGYKNVMSTTATNSSENFTFACMAMQLDNNGENDLEKWNYIQKNFLKREELSDIMSFKAMELNGDVRFILDEFLLHPENLKQGSETEQNVLKAFSLISSLTKRIKNEYFPPENSNKHNVLAMLIKDITKIISDGETAFYICHSAACKRVPHAKTADFFHSNINKKMAKYFKL